MALQPLSQGPPVALVGPGSSSGAGACAEERGRRFDSQRGVEGSTRAGGWAGKAASLAYRSAAQWGGEAVGQGIELSFSSHLSLGAVFCLSICQTNNLVLRVRQSDSLTFQKYLLTLRLSQLAACPH